MCAYVCARMRVAAADAAAAEPPHCVGASQV